MFDSHIGQICSNKNCRYQDYLPNNCPQCQLKFCYICFQEHQCPVPKTTPVNKPKKSKKKNRCIYPGCSETVMGPLGIKCPYCQQKTCVSHRHQHQDKCPGFQPSMTQNENDKTTKTLVPKSKKSFCPWFWSK